MNTFSFASDGLDIEFAVTEDRRVFFGRMLLPGQRPVTLHEPRFPLLQIQITGDNQNDHHARKHLGGIAGDELRYVGHDIVDAAAGRRLVISLRSDRLSAQFHLCAGAGPVFRCWTELENRSGTPLGIEYVSSLALWNIDGCGDEAWDRHVSLHLPTNNWYGEVQWKRHPITTLGLAKVNTFSLNRICVQNTGTWSCIGHLPGAVLQNDLTGTALFWQIEHHGSWQWEIGDLRDHLYLQLSGPTENENGWWVSLRPGERFLSVPVSFGIAAGGLGDALAVLNRHRRTLTRRSSDASRLPVIFNDYMNCLFGDPTTEKLIPLIDAASEAGCEYFCVDCGWYSDGPWWDGVGEWLPSRQRFPGGIVEVMDHIRKRGMVPGLWLEIEVMGIACRLAEQWPDPCFFMRHGRRVIDHQRYQLDFRHPMVIAHADEVIDRLVTQYGVGYIKMDYNINAGVGTEVSADSFGDGLLQHNRAYIAWLDGVYCRYPELVIENCGSGGLRMDWSLLSRHSIQSVTDQTDYRLMAAIAAGAASAATPEQCAIWSYPLRDGDEEEVVTNMVNAMLLRVHQSGHLAELSAERFALVREGISTYKTIRDRIPVMTPFWPLGLPSFSDGWLAFGLRDDERILLAVWRQSSDDEHATIPLPTAAAQVRCIYPEFATGTPGPAGSSPGRLAADGRALEARFASAHTARLFEIDLV